MFNTLLEAKTALAAKEISSAELAAAARQKIEESDQNIHAWLEVFDETAAGLPIGVKDMISTEQGHTTAASKMLANYQAPYNATVIENLQSAGFSVLGKTNLDEFAMGASTEYSAFGLTLNPWDTTRVAGGSSGGSAAAVAAGHVLGCLGTDTGGSIRHPAAFCGVVGLRPTYGRVSRFGVIAYGSSFDQVGPITRTVKDSALLLEAIAGLDPRDANSSPEPVGQYLAACNQESLRGKKIGIAKEFFPAELDPRIAETVHAAIDQLKSLGAQIVEISLPLTPAAIPVYYLLAKAEGASNLSRYDSLRYAGSPELGAQQTLTEQYLATRGHGLGPEVKRTILMGTYALSAGYVEAWYKKASQVRTLIRREYDAAFKQVDVIAGPTVPELAFKPGTKDALAMYLTDAFVTPASCAGLPAISVPCGFGEEGEKKLPVGLQFIAPHFQESRLFQVGHAYEQSQSWWKERPKISTQRT